MTHYIAVANEKGGVAKTTSVVSLGGALTELGYEVLVVDMDPQANLTLGLGNHPSEVNGSIADVMMNAVAPQKVSIPTSIEGLYLLPSNAEMLLAERFLPIRNNPEVILRDQIRNDLPYDYVIFDCPPSLGAITLNALNASDMLIIPSQPEYFSVYALRNMMSTIRQVREEHNPQLLYRVLITMVDFRNRTHRTLTEQLRATFKDGLFNTIIQTDTKLRESPIVGLPVTSYYSRTRSADQYRALAQEIIQHVKVLEEEKAPQPA